MKQVIVVYDINDALRRNDWINVSAMERKLRIPHGTIRPKVNKKIPERYYEDIVNFLGRLGVLDE